MCQQPDPKFVVIFAIRPPYCPIIPLGFILKDRSANEHQISRAMRMRKSETTTSQLLMPSMASLMLSCSHHIAGREAERFFTELALKLSEKKQIEYSFDRNSFAKRRTVSF